MQRKIRAVIMRGGTSKAVFLREEDLPPEQKERDKIILRIFGSPDPFERQIDGLGGATSTTSKVAIIGKSNHPDYDINYTFGQVSINDAIVDYRGNCGNISSAVGPFSIDEGLVEAKEPITAVRILNTNTGKLIVAHVPVENGKAKVEGDYFIDGVPFPGARIELDFYDPGGAVTGKLLPTGNLKDTFDIPGIGKIEVSVVDASNPVIFFKAESIGLKGTELPGEINSNIELLRKIEKIRSFIGAELGFASTPEEVTKHSPAVPKIAFISPPTTYKASSGKVVNKNEISLVGRIMSMGKLHASYALTGAICTSVASKITGTVVNELAKDSEKVRIGHPAGVIEIVPFVSQKGENWYVEKARAFRTARRLMEGFAFYPESLAL